MKKIISLLSVFAIICTMFTTVAFAGSDELYWEETVDGTNVTLTLKLDSSKTVTTAKLYFDVSAAKAACDSIAAAKVDATTFNYNATKGILAAVFANADGADSITLGTITFTNVKSNFSIAKAAESTSTKWVITDATKVDFIPGITNNAVGYEVKLASEEPEIVYPFDGSKAFSFKANAETYVSISKTNSEEVNNFWLPKGVKGDASVYGLFKYTADGTDVVAGDVFTIDFVNSDSAAVEVEVAQ